MRRPKTNVKKYNFKLDGQHEIISIEAGSLSTALNKLSTEENAGLRIQRATCTGKSGDRAGFVEYETLKGHLIRTLDEKEESLDEQVELFNLATKNQYND